MPLKRIRWLQCSKTAHRRKYFDLNLWYSGAWKKSHDVRRNLHSKQHFCACHVSRRHPASTLLPIKICWPHDPLRREGDVGCTTVQSLKHFLLLRAFRTIFFPPFFLLRRNEKRVSRANAVFRFRFGGGTNSCKVLCWSIMNAVTRRFHTTNYLTL